MCHVHSGVASPKLMGWTDLKKALSTCGGLRPPHPLPFSLQPYRCSLVNSLKVKLQLAHASKGVRGAKPLVSDQLGVWGALSIDFW